MKLPVDGSGRVAFDIVNKENEFCKSKMKI